MAKSPSRTSGYSALLDATLAQNGLVCFLCGQVHTRADRMQVDFKKPLALGGEATVDNAIPVCNTCAKRRHQAPLGAYLRKRLVDAQREVDYIRSLADNRGALDALAATVAVYASGIQSEPQDTKPWEGLERRVRVYNSERMEREDYDPMTNRPRNAQYGDVYVDYGGSGDEMVYVGKWRLFDAAQNDEQIPESWPPADAEQWRL